MKRFFLLSGVFLTLACVVSAAECIEGGYEPLGGDTLRQLNDLIEVTESNLGQLRQIRQQFIDYQKIKAQCLSNQQDKEQLLRMVKAASLLQKAILSQNISQSFDPETIKELASFSQIANKKGIPRP